MGRLYFAALKSCDCEFQLTGVSYGIVSLGGSFALEESFAQKGVTIFFYPCENYRRGR